MNSRARLSAVLSTVTAVAVLAFAGCGGGGDGGGTAADPAAAAPAGSPLFVEGSIRPSGDEKTAIEDLVNKATNGQVDAGAEIVKAIDQGFADDPDTKGLTYEDDIAPWLGEKAGVAFQKYDGQNFTGVTIAVQVTDEGAAQDFINKLKDSSKEKITEDSYKGFDFSTTSGNPATGNDPASIGIVDNFLVLGEKPEDFKAVVDTLEGGKSLESDKDYKDTVATTPDGSVFDIYANVGALIKQSGQAVDQQVLDFYNAIGTDFSNSVAVASVVPKSDSLELDVSTDAGTSYGGGDASKLIGSFPDDSIAALGVADVGKQIEKVLDGVNAVGFPPEVPKGALYSTFKKAGVDIKGITSKIGDVGVFVNGSDIANIGGVLVATTDSEKTASESVKDFTLLLKRGGTPGFTVLKGQNGFQIVSSQLPKPLVVISSGDRIAAGLGLAETLQAASGKSPGGTLADNPVFTEAKSALGSAHLAGFVNPKPLIALAQLSSDPNLEQALPYLQNLAYVAFGNGTSGDFATTKFILALSK